MPTFEVEIHGSVFEVEAPNENAAVAAAQKQSTLPREHPAKDASNSNAAGIVSGLSALAAGSMAAAPGVVSAGGRLLASKAAGVVPAAVAFDAAGDVMEGNYKKAATKGAAAAAVTQAAKLVPGAARVAGALRSASPYAAGISAITALHGFNESKRKQIAADPEVDEITKKAVEMLLKQMADRDVR